MSVNYICFLSFFFFFFFFCLSTIGTMFWVLSLIFMTDAQFWKETDWLLSKNKQKDTRDNQYPSDSTHPLPPPTAPTSTTPL